MKKILFFFLLTLFSANVFAQNSQTGFDLSQYGVRIEPDRRLITVLAALEAAGIETPLTTEGVKFRQRLKTDLQNLNPELRQKLKTFVEQYKRRHPEAKSSEIINPFITMAYALGPAPDLTDPTGTADLPGNLLDVLDFAPLVREFYRVLMKTKIDEYVKDYQKAGDTLRPSTVEMVSELLGYLHTKPQLTYLERVKTETTSAKNKKKKLEQIEQRERTRQFLIVPEMLNPKETINFLNIGDDYFTVVSPETDVSSSEVRRAFLQFVLEPLVLKNAKDIFTFRENIKLLLDEQRKKNQIVSPDIYLTTLRSLVAAVDARQIEYKKTRIATAQARARIERQKTDVEKRAVSAELEAFKKSVADETAAQLSEAYENGAVLSFYFAEQLKGLEDSGFDIAGSMRDIILSLDASKETNRLAQFAAARKRALLAREERRKNVANTNGEIVIESPVTRKLLEIEKIINLKNFAQAETDLKQLLAQNPSEPRIYYALGRVAGLSAENIADTQARNRRLSEAKVHYTNVLRTATPKTDPALLSLSYVALGRIYEFLDDDSANAIKIYEAAIKIGEVSGGAHKEAMAARDRLLKEQ